MVLRGESTAATTVAARAPAGIRRRRALPLLRGPGARPGAPGGRGCSRPGRRSRSGRRLVPLRQHPRPDRRERARRGRHLHGHPRAEGRRADRRATASSRTSGACRTPTVAAGIRLSSRIPTRARSCRRARSSRSSSRAGSRRSTVPSLVGRVARHAVAELTQRGLEARTSPEVPSDQPAEHRHGAGPGRRASSSSPARRCGSTCRRGRSRSRCRPSSA